MSSNSSTRVKVWECSNPKCKKRLYNVRLPVHHSCTPQGLGDTIASMIETSTGIQPCAGCNDRKAFLNWLLPYNTEVNSGVRYKTLTDLALDSSIMAEHLPSKTVVVGCARSGLLPASIVATLNHCELWSLGVETGELVKCGNGIRFSGEKIDRSKVTIIDDSMWSGHAMAKALESVSKAFPKSMIATAVLYGQPATYKNVDLCIEVLQAHVFEWNIFNSPVAELNVYDFDGILSPEVPASSDDDGRRYLDWLRNAPATIYRPLRHPLTIVTARLEKYREVTMQWLQRHGYSVERMYMGPWATNGERARADVGAWKASIYGSLKSKGMFIESCSIQSETIFNLTKKSVLCPPANRLWFKRHTTSSDA